MARKRIREVVADDGDCKISVRIELLSRDGLTREEVDKISRQAARAVGSFLPSLSYSDFGLENTKVR